MTTMSAGPVISSRLFGFVRKYGQRGFKSEIASGKVLQGDIKAAIKGLDAAASKEYLCGPATLQVMVARDDVDIQLRFPAQTFGYRSAREAVKDLHSSLAA